MFTLLVSSNDGDQPLFLSGLQVIQPYIRSGRVSRHLNTLPTLPNDGRILTQSAVDTVHVYIARQFQRW